MDTSRIKKFATEARNKLKDGVATKITLLGYDSDGNVPEKFVPQRMEGGALWNGNIMTEGWYGQWTSLNKRIKQIGIKDVYEEAAYTWFNRLVAIRILNKNGLCEPVLSYIDGTRTPVIVDEAHQGRLPRMSEQMHNRLADLLEDDTKTTEQFALLISAWCNQNPIINACFGGITDYTELLLPNDILTEGGFIDMLNHTEFITDEDFSSPELIGWLYQFYISERKDEVFAKKGKLEADEIPAATQIFTPNWIVKYMVQNTIGRIYLDNNPSAASVFTPKWKYLVELSEPTPKECVYRYHELTDLIVGDLACGSGHILNECFDILYDLYVYEGYSRREAIENIFAKNLRGIDLDTRAKQLSMFALMLKACQKDMSFADAHILPRVLDMPLVNEGIWEDLNGHFYCAHEIQSINTTIQNELWAAFALLRHADTLGSIMKFSISQKTRDFIQMCVDKQQSNPMYQETFAPIVHGMEIILTLTESYSALVMNPPYMGSGNMNETLSKYVKDNYEEGKADLFSTFMLLAIDRLADKGKYGMINMHSWMFLSSFERLRHNILKEHTIDSLLHLGPRTFDELSGEVVQNTAFTISKSEGQNRKGSYFRLVFGKNCNDKERLFLEAQTIHTEKIYYPNVGQMNFVKIPGCPIGYWVSDIIIQDFSEQPLKTYVDAVKGLDTCDNDTFTRYWAEVSLNNIGFGKQSVTETYSHKWFPYCKGGGSRKWYGLLNIVVDWENNGEVLRNLRDSKGKIKSRPQNIRYYFKEGITWSTISSSSLSLRYMNECIFGGGGSAMFCNNRDNLCIIQGFLNSKCSQFLLNVLNPTLNLLVGDILNLPIIVANSSEIQAVVNNNIALSREDWDAHETSWDFQRNELLEMNHDNYIGIIDEMYEGTEIQPNLVAPNEKSLEWRMNLYKEKWEDKFRRLHDNEEELNRQFISIYGLQDELTPDVPWNEITILQQGEISIKDNDGSYDEEDILGDDKVMEWHDDIIMQQLISYAVGVWMGRYRLDKPGLAIAHPNPAKEELDPYEYNGEVIEIDSDGIIPLMPNNCGFDDNASNRMAAFVRQVFGADNQVRNLNYIEKCLGKKLEQYFIKDFWKNHKKMYQNRPIYWLFSSRNGAFQVITYMHRMDAYTVERIRAKYLLPYIEHLNGKIAEMEQKEALLSTSDARQLENYRRMLDECREYHDRLAVYAEQAISFDLDDGVVVNYAKFGDIVSKIK